MQCSAWVDTEWSLRWRSGITACALSGALRAVAVIQSEPSHMRVLNRTIAEEVRSIAVGQLSKVLGVQEEFDSFDTRKVDRRCRRRRWWRHRISSLLGDRSIVPTAHVHVVLSATKLWSCTPTHVNPLPLMRPLRVVSAIFAVPVPALTTEPTLPAMAEPGSSATTSRCTRRS